MISDELIEEVKKETGGKNITDSITIALKEYLRNKKLNYVIDEVEKEPFVFEEGFAPYGVRKLNRDR